MHDYEPDLEQDQVEPDTEIEPFDLDDEIRNHRPDRYEQANQEWMFPLADKLATYDDRSRDELARLAALAKVRRKEADHAKRLNEEFAAFEDDALPLWDDVELLRKALRPLWGLPLMVGPYRVRLGAAEPRDLEDYLAARQADREERDAREQTEDRGVSNLLNAMRRHGITRADAA